MNKIKRTVALLLAVLLCLSLAGCRELDEMKANQGFWQTDGSVQLGQYTYRLLPENDEFYPSMGEESVEVTITEPDVPVLLATMVGTPFERSEDGVFLESWDSGYYCRADRYDSVVRRMEEGFVPEVYSYRYWVWDGENGYGEKNYTLTPAQVRALEQAIKTGKPLVLPDGAEMSFEYNVDLWASSADALFRRYVYEISAAKDTYYISLADSEGYTVVPAEFNRIFADIFSTYIAAEEGEIMESAVDASFASLV